MHYLQCARFGRNRSNGYRTIVSVWFLCSFICGCFNSSSEPHGNSSDTCDSIVVVWLSEDRAEVNGLPFDITEPGAIVAVRRHLKDIPDNSDCFIQFPSSTIRFDSTARMIQFVINHISNNLRLGTSGSNENPVPFPIPVAVGLKKSFMLNGQIHTFREEDYTAIHLNALPKNLQNTRPIIMAIDLQNTIGEYLMTGRSLQEAGVLWCNHLRLRDVQSPETLRFNQ